MSQAGVLLYYLVLLSLHFRNVFGLLFELLLVLLHDGLVRLHQSGARDEVSHLGLVVELVIAELGGIVCCLLVQEVSHLGVEADEPLQLLL